MIRSILKGQKGGVSIAIATGFLAISVPLISGSLDLAQTTSIDARTKTGTLHRQYCALAVKEYVNYLLMHVGRWENFLEDNLDPDGGFSGTVDSCGEAAITVSQQPAESDGDPLGEDLGSIPVIAAYSQRVFQAFKTVSDSNPNGGDSITYTITVMNRTSDTVSLNEIRDTLPTGFSYDCNAPADQLTLPGMGPQDIVPGNGPCPAGTAVDWDMPPGTSIGAGEMVTLTFTAVAIDNPGTYCNEVHVVPGGNKTSSGKTARVDIGATAGLCSGEAVSLTSQEHRVERALPDRCVRTLPLVRGVGPLVFQEGVMTFGGRPIAPM